MRDTGWLPSFEAGRNETSAAAMATGWLVMTERVDEPAWVKDPDNPKGGDREKIQSSLERSTVDVRPVMSFCRICKNYVLGESGTFKGKVCMALAAHSAVTRLLAHKILSRLACCSDTSEKLQVPRPANFTDGSIFPESTNSLASIIGF